MKIKSAFFLLSTTWLSAAWLAGCTPTVAERGNMVDDERLAKVETGATKDQVFEAIGSPTSIGTFDENTWYYMGQRTEKEAFFDPEVTDRKIVEISFDDNDKVAKIKKYGKDDAEPVEMVSDTTPPAGNETTLAEEIFGHPNMSKAAKKKKDN